MGYVWRFDIVWKYLPYLLGGLWITFAVSAVGLGLAIILGLTVATEQLCC